MAVISREKQENKDEKGKYSEENAQISMSTVKVTYLIIFYHYHNAFM